ncbi:MAG: DUF4013 domain-containing protein [Chloroflexi bacterium]|nr:DUF4013 domain-containing protein [Chloroflexota bacterium]
MNFSSAFRYPLQNLAKVLSIVLVLTIALSICLGLIVNSYDWSPLVAMLYGIDLGAGYSNEFQPFSWSTLFGVLGLLVVAVISGFWLSGYSVEVVRSVMNGMETMPAIQFGRNLKDGFYLFIAALAYGLLFAGLMLIAFTFLGLTGSPDGMNIIVVLASAIVAIVAFAFMGWAYLIGMARFAAEGDYKASWEVFRNIRLARENWRSGLMLLLYMIALTLIYGVVRSLVDAALGGLTGGFDIVSIALWIIVYHIFNLMQHFSTQHLIAQFGTEIGIRSDYYDLEKEKHD